MPRARASASPKAAVNFSSLLDVGGTVDATCRGGNYGVMNVRSFAGDADESALNDFVDAVTIDIVPPPAASSGSRSATSSGPRSRARTFRDLAGNPIPGDRPRA